MRVKISTPQKTGIVGKLFFSLFLLFFLGLGCFFMLMLIRESYSIIDSYSWPSTAAQIESVDIKRNLKDNDDNTPYELEIRYSYKHGSEVYKNGSISGTASRHGSYSDAYEIARKYPAGSSQTCYVNPKEPSEAILQHRSPWMLLFVILPLIFMLIGGGGLYFMWFARAEDPNKTKSIARSSPRAGSAKLKGVLFFFGLVFTLVGGGFTWYFVQICSQALNAQSWTEVKARVIDSDVLRSESTDSDGHRSVTYKIDIFYEYEYQGQKYRSSRYDFFTVSSSGSDSKREVVRRYRAGKVVDAYVNPDDPSQAVLNRDFSWSYLIGLIPLIFLLVGLALLLAGRKRVASQQTALGSTAGASWKKEATAIPSTMRASGRIELKPTASPLGKFFGITFIALFWNGIVSVFVYQAYKAWALGNPEWFLMIFLIPFVLVGALLVFFIFYQFLAVFNPQVALTLGASNLRLGDTLELSWQTRGNVSRLKQLQIILSAKEEASYRRGTDTHTERHTFYEQTLAQSQGQGNISRGSVSMLIPADSMHTFSGNSNKIIWSLKVKGEIPKWPDVDDEYVVNVEPGSQS